MSAYDNDPRVEVNDDGTLTVAVPCGLSAADVLPVSADGKLRVTYDPAVGDPDDAIRSLIGDPR